MQDASTQIKICFANIATQIEPGKMVDAIVQTEKKSKNIIVKNIDDTSTTDVTKWAVDMHAIGNIPDEHNATKHSSGHHHGNLRLSISTQTDISEKGYYSNVSNKYRNLKKLIHLLLTKSIIWKQGLLVRGIFILLEITK